jgi:hydrogenase nickel incorporation protein HypB
VGNLVCPASFDLGEALRVILFSVTEGEDKPLKYPSIFNTSDVALLSKMDLRSAVEFDLAAAKASIQAVRPGMEILEVSTRSGAGLDRWIALLESKRRDARFPTPTLPVATSPGGTR